MIQEQNQVIDFTELEMQTEPFRYFILPKAFDEENALSILDWLETEAPWKLVETDFYEQYEFTSNDVVFPLHFSFLYQRDFLDYLIRQIEEIFDVRLQEKVDLTIHKLLSGQTIRIHNDYLPGKETHRILLQLNRSWKDENGGFLIFFSTPNPKDIHRIIRPAHNSLVGFEISPKSNHAVSTIHAGERYTIVYSFYAKASSN